MAHAALGASAHVLVAIRIPQAVVNHEIEHLAVAHPIAGASLRQRVWGVRHRLHSSANGDLVLTTTDFIRRDYYRLEPRAAYLVAPLPIPGGTRKRKPHRLGLVLYAYAQSPARRVFRFTAVQSDLGPFLVCSTRYPAGAHLPLHAHEESYLTIVTDGEYAERVGSESRRCRAGSVVVHPPGERHEEKFSVEGGSCLNVHFSYSWLAGLGSHASILEQPAIIGGTPVMLLSMRLALETRIRDEFTGVVLEGLILELVGQLGRTSADEKVPKWIGEARRVIDRRFDEPLTLGDIAQSVGVHRVHLARGFRAHCGETVGEAIRNRRVTYATERIRSGDPLHVIALNAGFSDQSHFARTFRKVTGITPGAYRRSVGR